MSIYQFAALVLAAAGPMLALCGLLKLPASVALFALGVVSSFVPGLPPAKVEPDMALGLFLPALIYASATRISWHLLRFTLVPGVMLGAALVLATVAAVALAVKLVLLPQLSWTGALYIGVIASIFDTQLFHEAKGRPRVPRAISDVLKSRELVSRLFILASLTLAEEALTEGHIEPAGLAVNYLFDIPAGIVLGFVLGRAIVWARRRIDPAPVEIAVSLAAPFIAALAAEALGVSGVAAITATALVISAVRVSARTGGTISSPEARINSVAFWEEVSLILSSVLFFLAGRALPEALAGLEEMSISRLVTTSMVLLLVVLLVQIALSLPAVRLTPIRQALRASADRRALPLQTAGVMAWSSTRSVIALVIALSIPASLPNGEAFPERDLILSLSAFLVMGSILIQGVSLRWLVVKANLCDPGEEDEEVRIAREAMDTAAGSVGSQEDSTHKAARRAIMALRERNMIGDEVLTRMMRETDLHARASEENVLPGAGPPNP